MYSVQDISVTNQYLFGISRTVVCVLTRLFRAIVVSGGGGGGGGSGGGAIVIVQNPRFQR